MKYIRIVADTNDADHVTTFEKIDDKTLALITPVIAAIKAFKPYKTEDGEMDWTHDHNWPIYDCCRKDLGEKSPKELYVDTNLVTKKAFDAFDELVPTGEQGCHTIVRIEILNIDSIDKLL